MYERIKIPVKQGYGLTELIHREIIADLRTSPTTHAQEWGHWKSHIGSIGKIAPNMEAMIVDEDGNEVESGSDGELWMRGPNIFRGYLNNEEATRNSITSDGWFKTGDIAHVTPEGYVITKFRAKLKDVLHYRSREGINQIQGYCSVGKV